MKKFFDFDMLFCGTIGRMKWNNQWEVSVCITMQEMMILIGTEKRPQEVILNTCYSAKMKHTKHIKTYIHTS